MCAIVRASVRPSVAQWTACIEVAKHLIKFSMPPGGARTLHRGPQTCHFVCNYNTVFLGGLLQFLCGGATG